MKQYENASDRLDALLIKLIAEEYNLSVNENTTINSLAEELDKEAFRLIEQVSCGGANEHSKSSLHLYKEDEDNYLGVIAGDCIIDMENAFAMNLEDYNRLNNLRNTLPKEIDFKKYKIGWQNSWELELYYKDGRPFNFSILIYLSSTFNHTDPIYGLLKNLNKDLK